MLRSVASRDAGDELERSRLDRQRRHVIGPVDLVPVLALLATLAFLPAATLASGAGARVTGGGWFLFNGTIPMQFGFSAVVRSDGAAVGFFHHSYSDSGFSYEFWGTLTCLTYDPTAGRAWIGGVLTKVSSNDPDVGLAAGDDAWFRVLDSPDGDRSTAMGFVGVFPSSAEYCRLQPWPDGNARTHPVTSGQITLQVD
jgi:hypothetical protein